MATKITTELLGDHPALSSVDVKKEFSTSWIRSGDGLVGFGIWKSTTVKGPKRFNQAREWWREQLSACEIQNNVHGSGTGPILFASFAFDEDEESQLVIPEVIVGQKSGKSWITWVGNGAQPTLDNAATETIHPVSYTHLTLPTICSV